MSEDLQKAAGEEDEDQLLESLSAAREQRRAGSSAEAAPEPTAPSASAGSDAPAASEPGPAAEAQPDGIETAPWFAGLPPEAQDSLRQFTQRGSKAEQELQRAQQELSRINQGFAAMQGRVAPVQRQLEDARRRLAQYEQAQGQAQQRAQPKTPTEAEFQAWVGKQPEHVRRHFSSYPEEARAQYDIAQERVREEVDQRFGQLRDEFQQSLAKERAQVAMRDLRARHPDVDAFLVDRDQQTQQPLPRTEAGRAYLGWLQGQTEEIQALAWSDQPTDVATALDLYKWEAANPEYRETLGLPEFQEWARDLTRRERQMVYSEDIRERMRVLQGFWKDYEASAQDTPESKRAREIAESRQKQRQVVAPSIRAPQAPAAAAATNPEEADIEAVAALREQWRSRRK